LLNKRGTLFGKLCHDDLRFGVLGKDTIFSRGSH
jgi:hypothetical protein